jgi:outer membrane protein OmpU
VAANGPALLAAVAALGGNAVTVFPATLGGVQGAEAIGISVGAEFGSGLSGVLTYQEATYSNDAGENTATESDWGIGIGYQMNALTLALNYNQTDNKLGVASLDASAVGFVANYDLGGGLVVQFGAGAGEWKNGNTTYDADTYSLGVAMTF